MTKERFLVCLLATMLAAALSTATAATAGSPQSKPDRSGIVPTPPPPPPPPPPRPPPPPPPSDYTLYFGFDEAAITPQAQAIVAKAAGDVTAIVTVNNDYRAQMTRYNTMMTPTGQSPPALDAQAQEAYPPREDVVGFADTAGSTDYNLRLSERRAKAAADALVALGVPGASIQVSWKGEADPAVATGDNVREPMNRRVTIHVAAGMQ